MDYIPKPPTQPPQPKPEYELVDDVTHKPAPKRGPQTIEISREDENGKLVTIKVKVPHEPKPNCKKCYGRGYIGFDNKTKMPIACYKCYPPHA